MSKSHSKKRNCALIYEFLVRWMSTAIVEGRDAEAKVALGIIKKHYRPGTELYKEYRLAESLVKATVSSAGTAASILSEAKRAARAHDMKRLNEEKFKLLTEIHATVKDPLFWDRPVPLYKTLATVQTLLNDWRKDPRDIDLIRLAEYEDQIVSWLQERKESPKKLEEMKGNAGEDRLLLRIMSRKLEEKYGDSLTVLQRSIMKEYILLGAKDAAGPNFLPIVENMAKELLKRIDEYIRDKSSQDYEVKKLIKLKESIVAGTLLGPSAMNANENWFVDLMDCAKLHDELGSEE